MWQLQPLTCFINPLSLCCSTGNALNRVMRHYRCNRAVWVSTQRLNRYQATQTRLQPPSRLIGFKFVPVLMNTRPAQICCVTLRTLSRSYGLVQGHHTIWGECKAGRSVIVLSYAVRAWSRSNRTFGRNDLAQTRVANPRRQLTGLRYSKCGDSGLGISLFGFFFSRFSWQQLGTRNVIIYFRFSNVPYGLPYSRGSWASRIYACTSSYATNHSWFLLLFFSISAIISGKPGPQFSDLKRWQWVFGNVKNET